MALADQYNDFIKNRTHFQARVILKIGGVDVSDRLVEEEGYSVRTDALLDTPTLNVYTTARATFNLDNSDDAFNTRASSNFFTALGGSQDGWQTRVEISGVFDNDGAPEPVIFFTGYVEDIASVPGTRWASFLVLELSGLLQFTPLEDFGSVVRATIGGPVENPNYSAVNPSFSLPANSAPISRGSLSVKLTSVNPDIDLTVLPVLPRSGQGLTSGHAAVNENTGEIFFGSELEGGVDARVQVDFKTAYRYRAPERLVWELLEDSGIYSDYTDTVNSIPGEKDFAKTLLESPVFETTKNEFSSHGRPRVGRSIDISPVMRWIDSDISGVYMGGSGSLFCYRRRDVSDGIDDTWVQLSVCSDSKAAILQFEKVVDDFYVLTVSDWVGRTARLWKVTGGTAWSEILGF